MGGEDDGWLAEPLAGGRAALAQSGGNRVRVLGPLGQTVFFILISFPTGPSNSICSPACLPTVVSIKRFALRLATAINSLEGSGNWYCKFLHL